MMSKLPDEVPVLIVGAGPVGLAVANELSYWNVPYLLVEQGDGTVTFPAGENIFSRTMEHLRRWGIAQQVRASTEFPPDRPRSLAFATSIGGRCLALLEGTSNSEEPLANPYSPEGSMFCPKKDFDPALRAAAEQRGGDIRLGIRLERFSQTEEQVTADLVMTSSGESRSIHAQFMVACDGARSVVRSRLGYRYVGTFAQGYNFAVYFRAKHLNAALKAHFGTELTALHLVNVANRPYLTTVNGNDLWRLSMYVNHDDAPDAHQTLRDVLGSVSDFEVIRAQPWAGHRVVSDGYRRGRVFLAGDAAHLRWPKGGFGANTGIGDAVDIGWKLAAVLSGWGGPKLLDSYEAERRPIAVRNVNEASNNRALDALIQSSPQLDEDSPAGDAARIRMGNLLYAYRLREFMTPGLQLGYRYRNSPICVSDDTLEPPEDHMLYVPSTWPGSRAPHAWISPGRSMLDLYGRAFVLVRFDPRLDIAPLQHCAARGQVPFELVDVQSPAIRELYEADLVLVRPDGHVVWRGAEVPSDPGRVMARVTGRECDGSSLIGEQSAPAASLALRGGSC